MKHICFLKVKSSIALKRFQSSVLQPLFELNVRGINIYLTRSHSVIARLSNHTSVFKTFKYRKL